MKRYLCEMIGTLVLVLFGCGSAVLTGDVLATSLAFGLSLTALVYTIGDISGCHVNPAVSFAMFINGRLKFKDLVCYVIAQFIGAIGGAGLIAVLIKLSSINSIGIKTIGLGANGYGATSAIGVTMIGALLFEMLLTATFVFVVLMVSKDKSNKNAGLVIGLALALVHIFGIYVTGTSVNPARSFAPAILLQGEPLKQVWVFIVGPMVGSALAALTYMALNYKKKTEEQIEEEYIEKINAKEQKHTKKINEKETKKTETKKARKPRTKKEEK